MTEHRTTRAPQPLNWSFDRRIMRRVAIDENGCWIWQGCVSTVGYGQVSFAGKMHAAHRFTYEHLVGSVPAGLDLDHLCRVRRCINPAHLEPVTRSENLLRSPLVGGRRDR